jgi:hypothetical protein
MLWSAYLDQRILRLGKERARRDRRVVMLFVWMSAPTSAAAYVYREWRVGQRKYGIPRIRNEGCGGTRLGARMCDCINE